MKRAFVIGHPIAHSRSPLIHGYWIELYGLSATYEAIDVSPENLPGFFDRLRAREFVGGNVTVPHKEAAYALCDLRDLDTGHIGAFNTLSLEETDRGPLVYGRNTDLYGFLANLDAAAPGWDRDWAETDIAVILGAGGAARAVAAGLDARLPGHVHVLNRSPERAIALAADLGGSLKPGGMEDFARLAPRARLLVNTTTIGMHGTRLEGLDLSALPKNSALVTDIVYTPLETPLLAEAREHGLRTVDGLGMLLHQAVPGFQAWFGLRPDVTLELRTLLEATLTR